MHSLAKFPRPLQRRQIVSLVCPVDAMEEELCGTTGVLLADSGGCACFLVSRVEVAPDGGAGALEIEDARGVHDEDRPIEKLVHANACRSSTSHSALQA